MSKPNPGRGLADVAEAAGISRLLAEVTRRPAAKAPPTTPPEPQRPSPPEKPAPVEPPPLPEPPETIPVTWSELADASVANMFRKANWRNAPAEPPPAPEPQLPAVAETRPAPQGPEYVPVGVVPVAEFFALVNWRNTDAERRALPVVAPDRPTGYEWTVEAVMSAFFGD